MHLACLSTSAVISSLCKKDTSTASDWLLAVWGWQRGSVAAWQRVLGQSLGMMNALIVD